MQVAPDLRWRLDPRPWVSVRFGLGTVLALAVDDRGSRIGYGKGFYDRLLPRLGRAARVAVIFAFEQVAEVPNLPHDAPVDVVLTDEGLVRVEPARA